MKSRLMLKHSNMRGFARNESLGDNDAEIISFAEDDQYEEPTNDRANN